MKEIANAELEAAKAKHREDIRAIEKIEALASSRNGEFAQKAHGLTASVGTANSEASAGATARKRLWIGLRHSVNEALAEKPSGIGLQDIWAYIARTYPNRKTTRRQISRCVYRMKHDGELRMTQRQSGSIPGRYVAADKGALTEFAKNEQAA